MSKHPQTPTQHQHTSSIQMSNSPKMSSFSRFLDLSQEIRTVIWKLALPGLCSSSKWNWGLSIPGLRTTSFWLQLPLTFDQALLRPIPQHIDVIYRRLIRLNWHRHHYSYHDFPQPLLLIFSRLIPAQISKYSAAAQRGRTVPMECFRAQKTWFSLMLDPAAGVKT